MPISLNEARMQLLKGLPLSWGKFENHKSGSIVLETPGARRLFNFLAKQNSTKVADADPQLFPGLIAAWQGEDDPAGELLSGASVSAGGVWRLARIEACNFGGLTTLEGPPFDMIIGRENWCLEGQNGCGKTSLGNAILWAMTGKRIREQDGLIEETGARAPVTNTAGKEIGTWPPLVSYPNVTTDLGRDAIAWVRLTFENENGERAVAERKITSPRSSDPSENVSIDERLTTVPQLLETGLLMPARISRIGFGDKSQSLYEAVKILTGLDQLGHIADGASKVGNKAQRFYKYAKDLGIETIETGYYSHIEKAEIHAKALNVDLSIFRPVGQNGLDTSLEKAAKSAAAQASLHISTLKSEIAEGLDTTDLAVRTRVRRAVESARAIAEQGVKGIPEFEAWTALKGAAADECFAKLPDALTAARKKLDQAFHWHRRQVEDSRLRLKALAATYFVEPEADDFAICPLCKSQLANEEQRKLAAELEELRRHAAAAERKIEDTCGEIERDLREYLTSDINRHLDRLSVMVPKEAYSAAAHARFATNETFSGVLTGLAKLTDEIIEGQMVSLPVFLPPAIETTAPDVPDAALKLCRTMHALQTVCELVKWWDGNATDFRKAWSQLIGRVDGTDKAPERSIAGRLEKLEQAIEKAEPFDQLAESLNAAIKAAAAWQEIQEQQRVREAIIEALEPLKELRHLVGAETARSISTLSDRIKTILEKIRHRERFTYQDAFLGRKTINVKGSFNKGVQIDALLVANTSWLRAILWAFILALREETIEQAGSNPMPLVLLDDPQVTFDPRNKRKWAEEIVRLANADEANSVGMQLILTTHEQQFFQFLVEKHGLKGQRGLLAPINESSRVVTVVNGTNVDRLFREAEAKNDDALARDFIAAVRVYAEDLLRCMMQAESPGIADFSLDQLRNELRRLRDAHVPPFNRKVFRELIDMLTGGGGKEMGTINDTHHKEDTTIGVAQAQDIKIFWDDQLRMKLHHAFHVYAQFEAFGGESRLFAWQDNVIDFPDGRKEALGKARLVKTGIAAAAKTDGRAGDGVITLKELESTERIRLFNHGVYQLSASTLDPIAGVGDFLIVSNFAPVTKNSLVVATFGDQLLARRYSETDVHPDMVVLAGQTLDPRELPQPVIAPKEKVKQKKVVGTLFLSHRAPPPPRVANREVVAVTDLSLIEHALADARLFEVNGRSAEPLALDTQLLITQPVTFGAEALRRLEGRLVIAVDDSGERNFKRLRVHAPMVVLESLNPDGTTPAQLLSLDGSQSLPTLTGLLEVVGVLYEAPERRERA